MDDDLSPHATFSVRDNVPQNFQESYQYNGNQGDGSHRAREADMKEENGRGICENS